MSQPTLSLTLMGYYDLPPAIQEKIKQDFHRIMRFEVGYLEGFLERQFKKRGLVIERFQANLKATDQFWLGLSGTYHKGIEKNHPIFQKLKPNEQQVIEKIKKKYEVEGEYPYLTTYFDLDDEKKTHQFHHLLLWLDREKLTDCFISNLMKECQLKDEEEAFVLATLKKFHTYQEEWVRKEVETIQQLVEEIVYEIIEIWFYQTIDEELGDVWYDEQGMAYRLEDLQEKGTTVHLPKSYTSSSENWDKKEEVFLRQLRTK